MFGNWTLSWGPHPAGKWWENVVECWEKWKLTSKFKELPKCWERMWKLGQKWRFDLYFLKNYPEKNIDNFSNIQYINWCKTTTALEISTTKPMEPTSLGQPTIAPIGFSELLQIKMVHITLARSKVTTGKHTWLVVYLPLWKIWVRQLGRIIYPICIYIYVYMKWKITFMFQTTNQILFSIPYHYIWDRRTDACHLGSGTAVQAIRRKHSGHANLLGHSCSGAQGPCRGTAVDRCHRRRAGVGQVLQDLLRSEAWLLVAWRNKGKGGSKRVENVANLRVPGKEHPLELGTV